MVNIVSNFNEMFVFAIFGSKSNVPTTELSTSTPESTIWSFAYIWKQLINIMEINKTVTTFAFRWNDKKANEDNQSYLSMLVNDKEIDTAIPLGLPKFSVEMELEETLLMV